MRDLYETISEGRFEDLTREDLRRVILELVYSIYTNNSKWDYIDIMREALDNINELLSLEGDQRFTVKEALQRD